MSSTNRTDRELVQATLDGNSAAFDQLVVRHQSRTYNVALRVTGNVDDAMDATQAAFLKAFDNLHWFDPPRRFFSWICRIGVNEAIDIAHLRKRVSVLDTEPRERAASPEQECAGQETGQAIHEALQELTRDYRIAIVLRHLHQMTYAEISEVTNVPVKTVKSRLFTARRQLRQKLTARGVAR